MKPTVPEQAGGLTPAEATVMTAAIDNIGDALRTFAQQQAEATAKLADAQRFTAQQQAEAQRAQAEAQRAIAVDKSATSVRLAEIDAGTAHMSVKAGTTLAVVCLVIVAGVVVASFAVGQYAIATHVVTAIGAAVAGWMARGSKH